MTKRIKIVHLIATNFYGGPEKQILEHGKNMFPQDDFAFCLISFVEDGQKNDLLERADSEGIEIRPLVTWCPFNPKVIRTLRSLLIDEKCDLLVAHGYKANVIGRLVTWSLRIPQVSVSRGWTAENNKIRLYEKLDRVFLRFANHIVAVSHGQRKKILELGIKRENSSVIHNAINLPFTRNNAVALRSELGCDDSVSIIIGAGRLSPEKNFLGFIEVALNVVKVEPNVVFVVFGEGSHRLELEEKIVECGLERKFFLPGFRDDISCYMEQADIFFQSSFTEGLPNVVLEAFAAKRPVVATDVGGTSEVVVNERNGYLVQPADTTKIARRILHLLSNPDLMRQMGQNGYEYVSREFSFDRQTNAYISLYHRLIDNNLNHKCA